MVTRTIRAFRAILFLLALPLASRSAAAQGRPVPCPTRMCAAAPCPQPPCPVDGRVVRSAREVRVRLDGRVLAYEVTERWTNHGRALGEADYVLPLPRGAAFEDLALMIDGEMVRGEIRGAGEARSIYEEIVRRQRDPALVEWMDQGVLRTRIFPIQPGETRTVTVRFRAVAEREGDALRIDVPAPRGSGTDAGTALRVEWPQGEGFGDLWSPTHQVQSAAATDGRRVAQVADAVGTVTLLLPVRGRGAAMTVLTHAPQAGDGYVLLTLTPPAQARATTPRDVLFVIDVSGSMGGEKLRQAKAAGRQLLQALGARDRFQLLAFSNDVQEFAADWRSATAGQRDSALAWLDGLEATGGTNIDAALTRALETQTPTGRLGMILFLTDGAPTVGLRDASQLAARASERRGARRVFTFGLGADVNAALLEQLALDGAGTAHFVRPQEDVERVVGVVAQRITRPVATDLRLRTDGGVRLQQVMPAGRLDLFAGQELTVLARYTGAADSARVTVSGQGADGEITWTTVAAFPERRTSDAFVGRLWATQRVGWLSAERRRGGASTELDDELRRLGERWGIPTPLTSYLVLEPGMVPSSPPRPAADASFEQARLAASQREARSLARNEREEKQTTRRQTATRSFVLRDSTWTDLRVAGADARRVGVQAYSDAYFALMERIPELREAFALGDRVEVHGRAVTLVLTADGAERLSASELSAIVRDW